METKELKKGPKAAILVVAILTGVLFCVLGISMFKILFTIIGAILALGGILAIISKRLIGGIIIGAIGGLIGIVFTFIIEGPVSLIINARFPEQKIGLICNLNPLHALLLVLVSVLLTFVAGFIPARKAAKKDPVVALRTE